MKYHDNNVFIPISAGSGYKLKGGSYTLENYSVTSGQDPDNKIHKGLTNTFDSKGEMTFEVGRKSSDSVAKWFNNQVSASQTTFNHEPDKLNFAFIGKLKLKVSGGVLGNREENFEFSNITIAQGHFGASNNWWFGGKNCKYIGSDTVSCEGLSESGLRIEFKFRRGGNSVNEIMTSPNGVTNWMNHIDDKVTLEQLMMPASHDAGMSELHHCNPFIGAGPYTQTQSGSIGNQLANGSRFFDIRVDFDYGQLVTHHRTKALGCNGQDLKGVFDQARSFLKTNNQETAIFKILTRNYGDDHKAEDIENKINAFINDYKDIIYVNSDVAVNLAKVQLGDTRGKLILVFDYSQHINPATGRFRYKDGSTSNPNANITVYDSYSNTPDYEEMKKGQLEEWNNHNGVDKGYFFLLSWTLTSNNPPLTPSIQALAQQANSHLASVLDEQIIGKKWNKPNFVYLDYINANTTQSVISYNLDGSLALKNQEVLEMAK